MGLLPWQPQQCKHLAFVFKVSMKQMAEAGSSYKAQAVAIGQLQGPHEAPSTMLHPWQTNDFFHVRKETVWKSNSNVFILTVERLKNVELLPFLAFCSGLRSLGFVLFYNLIFESLSRNIFSSFQMKQKEDKALCFSLLHVSRWTLSMWLAHLPTSWPITPPVSTNAASVCRVYFSPEVVHSAGTNNR